MKQAILAGVVLLLTLVATAGVIAPLRRRSLPELQPLADPLEDRRLALALALRDLEAARFSGGLEEMEYARLRTETEGSMARVLRALDRRERRRALPDGNGEAVPPPPVARPAQPATRKRPPAMLLGAAVLAVAAATTPVLLGSLSDRSGDTTAAASLSSFEQRVLDHPWDVAARLDLARRYLDSGRLGGALEQYQAALALDPNNVDALAHMGLVLHLFGRPDNGLQLERQALRLEPGYPDALFFEGLILYRGLDRPRDALRPLRSYLEVDPPGPDADQVRALLRLAMRDAAATR